MPTPAETSRESSIRSRVIWSFWVVILLLGMPTWWQTTSIYRAALPIEPMLQSAGRPLYPVEICLSGPPTTKLDVQEVAKKTEAILKEKKGPITFQLQNSNECQGKEDVALLLKLEPGKEYAFAQGTGTASVNVVYQTEDAGQLAENLAKSLEIAFSNEQASVAYLLATHGRNDDELQQYIMSLDQEQIGATERGITRSVKPAPTYHLTFSLFSAGALPSSWAVQEALSKHIYPLVHALESSANFSIASQVQLYSTLSASVQPQQSSDGWFLRKEDLTSFVNAAEWPLSPSIGIGPTINFLLYIPSPKHLPLSIEDNQSNAWLIPQWGGIAILNPSLVVRPESELQLKDLPTHLDLEALSPIFTTFQTQLLQLLGVSQSSYLPLEARLKAFQRLAALSLYLRASSNLGSLARLSQSLSSIPIPKHVLHFVEHTLGKLHSLQLILRDTGSKWKAAGAAAREAFTASEKAFFDKSMVGQVYFPDEHKVAVYLPLLGPIGVPLVLGLVREMKKLLKGRTS